MHCVAVLAFSGLNCISQPDEEWSITATECNGTVLANCTKCAEGSYANESKFAKSFVIFYVFLLLFFSFVFLFLVVFVVFSSFFFFLQLFIIS